MEFRVISSIFVSCLFAQVMTSDMCCQEERNKRFLIDEKYELCEGEEASNFTGLTEFRTDLQCSLESIDFGRIPLDDDSLTACLKSGQKVVTTLRTLSRSVLPSGAFFEIQQLAIGLNGFLEGKYILKRIIIQKIDYLKECSSILGQQAVSSKLAQLLISKKLDLNCLVSPSGCWEIFKKGCTTICKGETILVQSDANIKPFKS